MPAAEAEEVDEEPERDRGDDRERDRARPRGRRRAPLLDRREHRAAERGAPRRRAPAPDGRSPVAIEMANGTTAPQATTGETTLIVPSESAR